MNVFSPGSVQHYYKIRITSVIFVTEPTIEIDPQLQAGFEIKMRHIGSMRVIKIFFRAFLDITIIMTESF